MSTIAAPAILRNIHAAIIPYGPSHVIADHYGQPALEHHLLINQAGVVAATHRGVLRISGKDRLKFLQSLLTQDVKTLADGDVRYSFMLNIKGRISADMVLVPLDDSVYLDLDARIAGPLLQTFDRYLFSDAVVMEDISGRLARISVIGPDATGVLATAIPGISLPAPGKAMRNSDLGGWIYRRDILGLSQWELAVGNDLAIDIWHRLTADGNGTPVGWSAFNTARVAAGAPWYGIDITDQHLPMETGPAYVQGVHLNKGCYIGQEVVARMHSHQTVARALMGMDIASEIPPAAGAALYDGEQIVGNITSAAPVDRLRVAALGYVKKSYATSHRELSVHMETGRAKLTLRAL